jgi:hypothetical protein
MLGHLFWGSTGLNQRVNKGGKNFLLCLHKKQNVEIGSSASSGDQGNYIKDSFPWPPLEAALSIFNISSVVKKLRMT